jgi:hypothetical protein
MLQPRQSISKDANFPLVIVAGLDSHRNVVDEVIDDHVVAD